ncbi:hypothetical protein RRG08_027127 [Elysia crispata]|uniref:Uncharacterized protein n=1 Tax=Elysia crispata TaxID=231223 RepID=A0AAE0YWE8_9GAST|nr:hypothetical protein RRG08_027127 [Elysia crispata]
MREIFKKHIKMKFTQVIIFIGTFALSGVCASDSGLSHADKTAGDVTRVGVSHAASQHVLSKKPLVGNDLSRFCPLHCPVGTRCSVEFGAPHCVSVLRVGHGGHLGKYFGFNLFDNFSGRRSFLTKRNHLLGFDRCAPLNPACIATRLDHFQQCRFTFDLRFHRCVKVYVRNGCAIFDHPHHNLFSTRSECELSCGWKLTY